MKIIALIVLLALPLSSLKSQSQSITYKDQDERVEIPARWSAPFNVAFEE